MPPLRTVYGLVDPRDGCIRYVGQCVRVEERMRAHVQYVPGREDHPKWEWITELKGMSLQPQLVIFGKYPKWTAQDVELNLIRNFVNGGANLTNIRGAGPSERDKQKHREHSERMKARWAEIKAEGYRNLTEASARFTREKAGQS